MKKWMSWVPLATAAVLLAGLPSEADANFGFLQKKSRVRFSKQLQLVGNAKLVRPVAIALHDANFNRITPWYPVSELDNNWPNGPWCTVFDTAEVSPSVAGPPPQPNGTPTELPGYGPAYMVPPNYGLTSAQPGARWFFGPTYENPFNTNDIEVSPLYGGSTVTRLAAGWYWNPEVATERMIVTLSTAETFADTVAGFPPVPPGPINVSWQGFIGGIMLDFGNNMGAGYGPGFYFFNDDLNDPVPPVPLALTLPEDGKGALIMTILQNDAPATLASRAQPMLWWAKQTNYGLPGGNPSKHGKWQWDDDTDIATGGNIPDGRHMTDPPGPANRVELYDYSATTLPPPLPPGQPASESLGAMVGLYSNNLALGMESFSITVGTYTGGTVASLRMVDGNPVSGSGDEFSPVIQMRASTTAPNATTTRMRVIFNGSASLTSDLTRSFQLYNFVTNSTETIGSATPTATTSKKVMDIVGDPSRFINPSTREIRFFVTDALINEISAFDGFGSFFERVTIEVACP